MLERWAKDIFDYESEDILCTSPNLFHTVIGSVRIVLRLPAMVDLRHFISVNCGSLRLD